MKSQQRMRLQVWRRLEPDTKNHGCKVYLPMHCARAQGLELYANADSCNEILHCNSCPIFTLAAEQVVIHCTTAPRNALFLSAHREQIDPILNPCTLLIASECNPVLCSPRASAALQHRSSKVYLLTASKCKLPSLGRRPRRPTTYRRSLVYTRAAKRHTACSTCRFRQASQSQPRDDVLTIPTRKRRKQQWP